jgi:hypothetical protein
MKTNYFNNSKTFVGEKPTSLLFIEAKGGATRDRCYVFLNIFAEKFDKKLAFFATTYVPTYS